MMSVVGIAVVSTAGVGIGDTGVVLPGVNTVVGGSD